MFGADVPSQLVRCEFPRQLVWPCGTTPFPQLDIFSGFKLLDPDDIWHSNDTCPAPVTEMSLDGQNKELRKWFGEISKEITAEHHHNWTCNISSPTISRVTLGVGIHLLLGQFHVKNVHRGCDWDDINLSNQNARAAFWCPHISSSTSGPKHTIQR